MPSRSIVSVLFASTLLLVTWGATRNAARGEEPSTPPLDVHMRRPADELATIQLPPGYHLELVASDPDVICPVLCAWDGNGRMYVAEMRSYMLDINGSKAHTPVSRVSRWEQTGGGGAGGEGVYDKHTIYADKLMLPRMVLPLDDRVLIRCTDTKDIWCYRDTQGTGIADEQSKIYEGGKQEGNLEHQPSGLVWDIDNWIYVTNQDERFRFTRGKIEKSALPFHPGQWGIATTDTGQLIFATAGSERPAHNFQFMPQYGDIDVGGELSKDFTAINPIEYLTDVEGGPTRLRPQGGLNRFSACAGPCIYRGDALPGDMYGDYILPEPVGRLIRRAKVNFEDGKMVLSNPYAPAEFIESSDPNFRPVWAATGPDGLLYFCDMYHGIIQEANWTKEGSFLRPQILKYGLQKNIGAGRIWRLVHDGFKPRPMPHMLNETPEQLVAHLSDPNGWWRDTAQKLIILRGDKAVVPMLEAMSRGDKNPIARLHALWTLEGLDAASPELITARLADTDPRLREAAVRIAEPLMIKNGGLAVAVKSLTADKDGKVAAQACLSSLNVFGNGPKPTTAPTQTQAVVMTAVLQPAIKAHPLAAEAVRIYRDHQQHSIDDARKAGEMAKLDAGKAELFKKGREAYAQTCIACHAPDGMGMPAPEHNGTTLAPPLRGSRKLLADKQICTRIILHGLVGPNNGKTYAGQMASFKWADDTWLASILTYARNDWGNSAPAITAADIAAARKMTTGRNKPFTIAELYSAVQASAPVAPTGAKVVPRPNEVVFDPCTAQLQGGIRVDCYANGLDIGFWDNWQDTVTWKAHLEPGEYAVAARTTEVGRPSTTFVLSVEDKSFEGITRGANAWDEYHDVKVGTIHIDEPRDVTIQFRGKGPEVWGPTNLACIRLAKVGEPTTRN